MIVAERGTSLAWRIAAIACTVAAFVLFAWVAAHWIWRWASPGETPVAAPSPADPAAVVLASGLWSGGSDAPVPAAALAPGDVRLLGVLAERDGKGLGVFRTREGARVVPAGGEVVTGTTLVSVGPSSVRLRDAGGERTVELRREDAQKAPLPSTGKLDTVAKANVATPRSASPGCVVPQGFAGPVLKLHAELLDGLIAQPESWRPMLAADNGALVVREDGGFAQMMGLAKGDRLVQANGIALRDPDDVTGAVLRPLASSQTVRIAGQRGGQPRELFVMNASACP